MKFNKTIFICALLLALPVLAQAHVQGPGEGDCLLAISTCQPLESTTAWDEPVYDYNGKIITIPRYQASQSFSYSLLVRSSEERHHHRHAWTYTDRNEVVLDSDSMSTLSDAEANALQKCKAARNEFMRSLTRCH